MYGAPEGGRPRSSVSTASTHEPGTTGEEQAERLGASRLRDLF
jgi:hypothetical protein